MTNIGLRLQSTGKSQKKVENMWSGCFDDAGAFPNIENIKRIDTKGTTWSQLVISLNVFIS